VTRKGPTTPRVHTQRANLAWKTCRFSATQHLDVAPRHCAPYHALRFYLPHALRCGWRVPVKRPISGFAWAHYGSGPSDNSIPQHRVPVAIPRLLWSALLTTYWCARCGLTLLVLGSGVLHLRLGNLNPVRGLAYLPVWAPASVISNLHAHASARGNCTPPCRYNPTTF